MKNNLVTFQINWKPSTDQLKYTQTIGHKNVVYEGFEISLHDNEKENWRILTNKQTAWDDMDWIWLRIGPSGWLL
jgi:hypothetical protein